MPTDAYVAPWKQIAENWAKLGVGNHPSPENLAVYERFMMDSIVGVEKSEVLLLGSTPEIRDVIARYSSIHLTVLDINEHMIEAMVSFMVEEPVNESWEVGNWLDADLPEHYFDCIIGDHVKENISTTNHHEFFSHLNSLLKPTGLFVTRLISRFHGTPVYDPHELIERYSKIKPTKQSLTDFWNLLCFQTHEKSVSTSDRMYSLLEEHLDRPYIQEYKEHLLSIIPRGKEWSIGQPWGEEKQVIEKYFDIVDKVQDDTVFKDSTFVYKLRPKAL